MYNMYEKDLTVSDVRTDKRTDPNYRKTLFQTLVSLVFDHFVKTS